MVRSWKLVVGLLGGQLGLHTTFTTEVHDFEMIHWKLTGGGVFCGLWVI